MLFANSKLVRILTELLDEEHKKRIAARRRVKELEALLDESESKTDAYSYENVGLRRKLSLALTGEEKEVMMSIPNIGKIVIAVGADGKIKIKRSMTFSY